MAQYLLNVTCIWLLSLTAYWLLLRKGFFHTHNRMYLLLTFLAGVVLPLIELPAYGTANNTVAPITIQHLSTSAGKALSLGISPVHTLPTPHWHWIGVIYTAGFLIMAIRLLADAIKLISYYHYGKRSKLNNLTIIETGHEHAPFSLLNNVYVTGKLQYNDTEWQMLLAHEQRHYTLMHFPELLLMQIAAVIFWFHPLVHLYRRQLSLIHEYQADSIPDCRPQAYARFLIEQSMLHTAPLTAHSFSGAPIKERIEMLVNKTNHTSQYRLLVIIPLMAFFLLSFTKAAHTDMPVKTGNICHYKGNTIEFQAPQLPDSYQYKDEKTGEVSRKPISWPTPPIKLNGHKIYLHGSNEQITLSRATSVKDGIVSYLCRESRAAFEQLEDGNYAILLNDVLIDTRGNITWFENYGVIKIGGDKFELKEETEKKINELLANAPAFTPAMLNGLPIAYLITSPFVTNTAEYPEYHISVRNHKITWNISEHQQ